MSRRCGQIIRLGLVILWLCAQGRAEADFARYQVILDRKPFGEKPPEPEPVVIPEDQKFVRNFRMSAIVEVEGDWKIGLIELKTNEDFYLGVGETEKGVTLVGVDWDAEEATIQKGEEMVVLKLGTGEVTPADGRSLPAHGGTRQNAPGRPGLRRQK